MNLRDLPTQLICVNKPADKSRDRREYMRLYMYQWRRSNKSAHVLTHRKTKLKEAIRRAEARIVKARAELAALESC